MIVDFLVDENGLTDIKYEISKEELSKYLGKVDLTLVYTLLYHIDAEGRCFPSIRRISELSGISKTTVMKRLEELEQAGILLREKVNINDARSRYKYKILADIKVNGKTLKEVNNKYYAKDVVNYFCQEFEKQYGYPYVPNYRTECSTIKNKILSRFGQNEIEEVISFIILNYERLWYNTKFPTPTIGMLGSWLFNKALPLAKESKRNTEVKVNYDIEF